MVAAGAFQNGTNLFAAAAQQRYELRHSFPRVLNFKWSVHDFSPWLHCAHGTFSFGHIDPDTEHGHSFFPDKILQCFRTGLLRFNLVRDTHTA